MSLRFTDTRDCVAPVVGCGCVLRNGLRINRIERHAATMFEARASGHSSTLMADGSHLGNGDMHVYDCVEILSPPRGSLWKHWKSGAVYRVEECALMVTGEEEAVVTYRRDGEPQLYVRTLKDWHSTVPDKGPRFVPVEGA